MNQLLQILVAGLASFTVITTIFFFVFLICKCKNKSQRFMQTLPQTRPRQTTSGHASTELSSNSAIGESASFDPCLQEVSMVELNEATNNFNPKLIIGDGGFGLVYKAKLANGVTVALKKLSPDAFQGLREFRAEMETLGKLRHENIVKMLGYCMSGPDRVLIYEFIEKGSLDEWLQDLPSLPSELSEGGYSISPLSWRLRVKIVKGIANGLAFMHCLDTAIVHRDIKSSNVLLDNNFEAHIADFGLARRIEGCHSHVSTQAAGTMGYMPPEYRNGYTTASVKGDVYSFGVLMFEVATGKRPNLPIRDDGCELWMIEWAKKRISENKHLEVIDTSIPRESLRDEEVSKFMKIAELCTTEKPKERPLMRQVVDMLDSVAS